MDLFEDLKSEEEKEFREWARGNFNPNKDVVNTVWHPVIVDECCKMIKEANERNKVL